MMVEVAEVTGAPGAGLMARGRCTGCGAHVVFLGDYRELSAIGAELAAGGQPEAEVPGWATLAGLDGSACSCGPEADA